MGETHFSGPANGFQARTTPTISLGFALPWRLEQQDDCSTNSHTSRQIPYKMFLLAGYSTFQECKGKGSIRRGLIMPANHVGQF
jgi:hypothetical protein